MLTAKDIMSTHLIEVDQDETVEAAAVKMDAHDVGSVIVMEGNMPVGIVTENDLSRKVVAQSLPRTVPLHQIMSSPLHTCNLDADIMEVAHALRTNHIKKIPVMSGGQLYGVVTQTDIVRHVVAQIQELAHRYNQGRLTSDQYAQQSTELFHTFNGPLKDAAKNWYMKCASCGYKFMATEDNGKLNMSRCPHCHSESIEYDQNPTI